MNIVVRIVAVVAGVVAGGCVVAAVEWISTLFHPLPDGVSVDDPASMKAWVATLPASAFLAVLVAWGAGCLTGSWVARRIAPARAVWPALIVVLLLTIATVMNLVMLPHPWWMWPAGPGVCLAGGLAGMVMAAPASYVVSTSRNVKAPAESVFQTLAQVENFSQAVPGITRIEILSDQKYGKGTRFREFRLMNGREASTVLEVTEHDENRRLRLVADAGGTIWDTIFTVDPRDHNTQMNMSMEARPRTLAARFLTPLILPMVQTAVESDMNAVKDWCERSTP